MAGKLHSHSKYGRQTQKRWRVAYIVIYFSRAMLYLPKQVYSSHTVLDIEPPINSSLAIDQTELTEMVRNKNMEKLQRFGGVKVLVTALETDPESGIHDTDQEVSGRKNMFGSNTYRNPPSKGLLYFILEPFILLACAALSLGIGIREHGAQQGWYDGASMFVAVFLVIAASSLCDFRQEREFDKLSKISNDIKINVMRDGRRQRISIFDVVVGDIVFLTIGDQIPADGLFLDGHSLKVDESIMSGESDHVQVDSGRNPFLFSGSKVADGFGRMVVISVGMNTAWGEMMSSTTRDSNQQTPLQERVSKLTSSIRKASLCVVFIALAVMSICYFTGNAKDRDINDVFTYFLFKLKFEYQFAAAVTIVVVAVPEGLPLTVKLTLAYSMKKMMADHALVRKLSACETIGAATVICTDKTGMLTLNQMKVTKFWIGQQHMPEDYLDNMMISSQVLEMYHQAVGLNTAGSISKPISGSVPEFSGSPTEKAILSWAVLELGMDMDKLKQSYTILHAETFKSEKKRSGVLVRKKADSTIHVHWKGAAEMVLAMSSSYYQSTGEIKSINEDEMAQLEKMIQAMAASSLRCIAFAHKQIPEEEMQTNEDGDLKEDELTFLGLVCLKDPCKPGTKRAIESCRAAGVEIKMITGDNVFTAKAIATECGILEADQQVNSGAVVEGVEFRNYSHEERMQKVSDIRVMARSTPFDKLLMVQCLKQKGHVVAVTGDGTNDAPALKEADIGLSMGIQGTEVAKESSDIVILDDNFATVVTVLRWGRCVYSNIKKFIQFQLTVNLAVLVIYFIAVICTGEIPLTTVKLLWVNLVMDTLGGLALATERPTYELMYSPPVCRTQSLITNIMWRNILAQALFQIVVLLTLQFKGRSIFNVNEQVKGTLIFNIFVLCQVFNEFNARKPEKKNVFKGIHKNPLFLGIVVITIVLQVVMVELLKKFADTVNLNLWEWLVCIAIAALTWPIGWFVKFIPVPNKPFLSYLTR